MRTRLSAAMRRMFLIAVIAIPFACPCQDEASTSNVSPATRQRLLSGAVALAISADNVPLLKQLHDLGWDPRQPMCDPSSPESQMSSLHAAAEFSSLETMRWLLGNFALEKAGRDAKGRFPIEYTLHSSSEKAKEIRRLLERADNGGLAGLIEAVLTHLGGKDSEIQWIVDVTATPDPVLVARLLRNRFGEMLEYHGDDDVQRRLTKGNAELIRIKIRKADGVGHQFSIDRQTGPSSGYGVAGTVKSEFGYWVAKISDTWRS